MPNYGLRSVIGRYALGCLGAGTLLDAGLPTPGLPAGVKPLDLWSSDRYGSVLFWVDRGLDVSVFDGARLIHHNAERVGSGEWRSTGGGAMARDEPGKLSASLSPGLNRFGGGFQDPMRVDDRDGQRRCRRDPSPRRKRNV
jgi:hypothetical protein